MRTNEISYLDRGAGRIAYDMRGHGPLVVAIPGMGDLRSTFDDLADALAAAGHRVATFDLRGHGDSDTGFDAYDTVAAGSDALALIEHLGGPAVLVGNSMGAGAAAWAAAERPDLVQGLALLGPFVRDQQQSRLGRALFRMVIAVLLARPWGPAVWRAYFRLMVPTRRDAKFAAHRDAVSASLRRPGRWAAFRATTRTTHSPAAARLAEIDAPTLVVMGTKDPDFRDPAAEARFAAGALHGRAVLVESAGHYPHAEFPEETIPEVLDLVRQAFAHA